MTRHPRPTMLAVTALVGCALLPPMGVDADSIPEANTELTQIKDARFGFCEEPDLDAALTEIMSNPDWNLVGCAAGWAHEGDVVYLTAQGVRTEDDPDTFFGNDNIPYEHPHPATGRVGIEDADVGGVVATGGDGSGGFGRHPG